MEFSTACDCQGDSNRKLMGYSNRLDGCKKAVEVIDDGTQKEGRLSQLTNLKMREGIRALSEAKKIVNEVWE